MRLIPRLLAGPGLLFVSGPLVAQQAAAKVEYVAAIDDELLLKTFANLASDSMQGRKIASPGSLKAREYIVAQLKRMGVEPLVPDFVTSFPAEVPMAAGTGVPQSRGATTILGQPSTAVVKTMYRVNGSNILGVVRGTEHPERYVLVSAHYDHIGIDDGRLHPGANDNASGAAALFAIADLLVAAKPKNSVILAFFDGKEYGMTGSTAFTRSPPVPIKQIAANVNIDMIGRTDDNVLYFVGEKYQARMAALATAISSASALRIAAGHDGRDSKEDDFRRSDQWSFHQRGIPAVLFTAEALEDYHRPTDIAAKVNVEFYIRAVSAISDFVRQLDGSLDDIVGKKR